MINKIDVHFFPTDHQPDIPVFLVSLHVTHLEGFIKGPSNFRLVIWTGLFSTAFLLQIIDGHQYIQWISLNLSWISPFACFLKVQNSTEKGSCPTFPGQAKSARKMLGKWVGIGIWMVRLRTNPSDFISPMVIIIYHILPLLCQAKVTWIINQTYLLWSSMHSLHQPSIFVAAHNSSPQLRWFWFFWRSFMVSRRHTAGEVMIRRRDATKGETILDVLPKRGSIENVATCRSWKPNYILGVKCDHTGHLWVSLALGQRFVQSVRDKFVGTAVSCCCHRYYNPKMSLKALRVHSFKSCQVKVWRLYNTQYSYNLRMGFLSHFMSVLEKIYRWQCTTSQDAPWLMSVVSKVSNQKTDHRQYTRVSLRWFVIFPLIHPPLGNDLAYCFQVSFMQIHASIDIIDVKRVKWCFMIIDLLGFV